MRLGFTLLELIIAVAILGGVMTTISMSLRTATGAAAAIDLRGDLNTRAWTAVRTIADAVRNGQVTSIDTTNGSLSYKAITDLSGSSVVPSAIVTIISQVQVTEGGETFNRLQTSTGTMTLPLADRIATTFIPIDAITLPNYGLTAPTYPGFLIARIGNIVVIGVTVEGRDPSNVRNPDGTFSQYRASAMTLVTLRN